MWEERKALNSNVNMKKPCGIMVLNIACSVYFLVSSVQYVVQRAIRTTEHGSYLSDPLLCNFALHNGTRATKGVKPSL